VGEVASVEVIDPDGHRPLSLSEARSAQTLRLRRAGFYQIRLASGRDAVIGVNPDRHESDLTPMAPDVQALWSGSSGSGAPVPVGDASSDVHNAPKYRAVTLWWYVILLALAVAVAETALASGYMGTQREDV
jgi:hypothetical protein